MKKDFTKEEAKKMADPECQICEGEGVVGTTWNNPDSHQEEPDGEERCICTLPDYKDLGVE